VSESLCDLGKVPGCLLFGIFRSRFLNRSTRLVIEINPNIQNAFTQSGAEQLSIASRLGEVARFPLAAASPIRRMFSE
jgi:hypothetical protein